MWLYTFREIYPMDIPIYPKDENNQKKKKIH